MFEFPMLTVKEAAKYNNWSVSKVYRLIKGNILDAIKDGGKMKVSQVQLEVLKKLHW